MTEFEQDQSGSSSSEQYEPKHRLENAENELARIEQAGGDTDRTIADFVDAANLAALADEARYEDAVAADEVGALRLLENSDSQQTATALGEQPTEPLGEALRAVAIDKGDESLEIIVGKIEQIEREQAANVSEEHYADLNAALEMDAATTKLQAEQAISGDEVEIFPQKSDTELGPRHFAREINATMESKLDDEDAKTEAMLEFLRTDMKAVVSELDEPSLTLLIKSISATRLESMASSGNFPEVQYLVDRISRLDFPENVGPATVEMHRRATRVIAGEVGGDMLTWRGKLRSGEKIPESAKRYAENNNRLASLYLHDFGVTRYEGLQRDHSKETFEEQSIMRTAMKRALDYAMDVESDVGNAEKRKQILEMFKHGDIESYGKSKDGVFNNQGIDVVKSYVESVEMLGTHGVDSLHRQLGTVNFHRYSPETLISMRRLLDANMATGQDLDVMISGRSGDYNNFIGSTLRTKAFNSTLIFEVQTAKGVDKAMKTLSDVGAGIQQLTVLGHGGQLGIAISNEYRLESNKSLAAENPINGLVERITPDKDLNKRVVLYSCSQGRRYSRSDSTAEMLASLHAPSSNLYVEAAPDVLYVDQESTSGEVSFNIGRSRDIALRRTLESFRGVPGVAKLINRLDYRPKLRREKVVIQDGRRRTVKGEDAKVRIGA